MHVGSALSCLWHACSRTVVRPCPQLKLILLPAVPPNLDLSSPTAQQELLLARACRKRSRQLRMPTSACTTEHTHVCVCVCVCLCAGTAMPLLPFIPHSHTYKCTCLTQARLMSKRCSSRYTLKVRLRSRPHLRS